VSPKNPKPECGMQIETRTLLASHRILHVNDQYEHIKSVSAELKEAYNEFNLMRANCLADMNQVVALTSTAVESKRSDSVSARNPLLGGQCLI